jgi:hypothetical protein
MDENELTHDTFSVKDKVEYLYERKTIFQNLVVVLVEMVEENEQKIRELKLAKRFVEVLLSDVERA